ncbi:MAG: pyridinium-3,5-biscarboxylic acid mononucleotide synthase [Candidatus Methanomethylophilaceae archaeon]|nr:pyridinium-3,5-biscarboxylic acid mononucleotide synthase [Candidatus Methanomethylophilaceae archaeon]MDI3541942.1 pyridinium-3,5-biscarboxylic acid mononucleotide synthase [Candidatus Methanomethylophilaceae archaeon]
MKYGPIHDRDMDIHDVLISLKEGLISVEEAEKLLRLDYIQRIEDHTVFDHARQLRSGLPEVIYGLSKDPETVADIVEGALEHRDLVIVSRVNGDHYDAVRRRIGEGDLVYERLARILVIDRRTHKEVRGKVGIITAGTSDIAIAEEARVFLEVLGCECLCFHDVGIAGMHRFLEPMRVVLEKDVDVLIVLAGMEGALPTLIASLSPIPVIGVPVSTGYGAGGGGEAALYSMLQSCALGLAVVNIDNGIGAAAIAAMIARRR